jgi:hypothetical protein
VTQVIRVGDNGTAGGEAGGGVVVGEFGDIVEVGAAQLVDVIDVVPMEVDVLSVIIATVAVSIVSVQVPDVKNDVSAPTRHSVRSDARA